MDRHLQLACAAAVTIVLVPYGPSLHPSARKLQIKNDMGHARGNPHFRRTTSGARRGSVVDQDLLFDACDSERFGRVFDASPDCVVGAHIHPGPLVIPIRRRIDLLEFGQCTRELAEGALETDLEGTDVY